MLMLGRLVANPVEGAYGRAPAIQRELPVMTQSDSVDLEFSRRLNRGLKRIAAAPGVDGVLLATTRAAHELTNADGLCAIPNDVSQGVICTAEDAAMTLLDSSSSLQRLVAAAAQGDEAIVQYRPSMEVELSPGRRLC